MQHVNEKRVNAPAWTALRSTAVTANEVLTPGSQTAAILANTYTTKAYFVDIMVCGTLSAGNTFDITIVEVNDKETPGTNVAYPVQHAFKDGSTTLTLAAPCVIPMVCASDKVGVAFTNKGETASVTCYIREA